MDKTLQELDDLVVQSGDIKRPYSFTLTCVIRNEMHFLPAFLPHYRALGIDRFIFLDDRSTDGSAAYLAAQPDVIVVSSQRRFGDNITDAQARALGVTQTRMVLIWRTLLLRKYCCDEWALYLDADEFLELPTGMRLHDLVDQTTPYDLIWSVMIDMYPREIADLQQMQKDTAIDLNRDWYFDGRPHLRLCDDAEPAIVYPGSRARLLLDHGLTSKGSWFRRNIGRYIGQGIPAYNAIRKPTLVRWRSDTKFLSSHSVTLKASPDHLLPLRHFKFFGDISNRATAAVDAKMHSNGARSYADISRLLQVMIENDASFMSKKSLRFGSFADFRDTGVAIGF